MRKYTQSDRDFETKKDGFEGKLGGRVRGRIKELRTGIGLNRFPVVNDSREKKNGDVRAPGGTSGSNARMWTNPTLFEVVLRLGRLVVTHKTRIAQNSDSNEKDNITLVRL